MLGDLERAVGRGLHDRITHVRQVGDALPVNQAIAAARLGAALDRVACHRARREEVPRVRPPLERMHQRREREPGVGHPARDHDVGTAPQRIHHGAGTKVGVGREDAVANVAQRAPGVEVPELVAPREQPVQPAEQVISRDDTDPQSAAQSQPPCRVRDRLRAGARVHAARVRRHLDPPLRQSRQDALHGGDEVLGVAERRIARALLLEDGHRDLGQVVHHQVVDGPPGHLSIGSFEPVSPEALARGNANGTWRRSHQ